VRHAALIVAVLCALALAAGAHGLELEGGTIAALNSDCDLGLSLSVGETLPEWVPLLGGHIAFADLLTVNRQQALGLSVSIRKAEADDGWRIGATITTPDKGPREVLGYLRYGVAIKF
jgi:hypothetical protein